jgi:hypothetical protein
MTIRRGFRDVSISRLDWHFAMHRRLISAEYFLKLGIYNLVLKHNLIIGLEIKAKS